MSLLELEVRHVSCPIGQLHDELAARTTPTLVGLPGVGVLIRTRIVSQAASTCRVGWLDVIQWGVGVTDYSLGSGITHGKNVQPLIPMQTKFYWNSLPRLDLVEHWWVADGVGKSR